MLTNSTAYLRAKNRKRKYLSNGEYLQHTEQEPFCSNTKKGPQAISTMCSCKMKGNRRVGCTAGGIHYQSKQGQIQDTFWGSTSRKKILLPFPQASHLLHSQNPLLKPQFLASSFFLVRMEVNSQLTPNFTSAANQRDRDGFGGIHC